MTRRTSWRRDGVGGNRPAIEVGASSVLQASGGGALWEEQGGAQPQAAPSAALQKVLDFAQKRVYDELDAECSVFAAHNALYVELGYENVPCYFDPEDTKGSYFLEIGPSGGGGPASFETEASFVLLVRVQKHANDDSAALRGYMMDETRIQRGLLANVPTAAVVYFIDGQIESVEVAYPQPKGARDPVARPDWGSKVSWDEIKALLIKAYDALCPPGADHLPEKVLQNELHQELFRRNVPCVREMPLFAHGKAFTVEEGRVDLVIAGRFFLELKIYKNVALSKKQVDRYRRMFEKNGIHIKNSAAVYFMPRTFNTVKGTWRNRYDINEFKY
ncbi:hypothetical protein T484DRAFT_1931769 [Baffinella frigidus]|nr:hypothetical protein T484DRAFT_1931769 [Cryptophyta sp. CCMP2293]